MSILSPKIEVSDVDIDNIIQTDFDRGLRIITAKVQKRLDLMYAEGISSDTQKEMTNVAHDAFFEFGMHWNLEYQIHCTPIVQTDSLRPIYMVAIYFKKPYSIDIQTITINVNP